MILNVSSVTGRRPYAGIGPYCTAKAGLDMLYVPKYSDVMHGDRVVTSGLDGIFPRGFGIGRVSSITEAADGSQTIHLEPELDFRVREEVMIVLEAPAGDEAGR